jgi:hypothetical protein
MKRVSPFVCHDAAARNIAGYSMAAAPCAISKQQVCQLGQYVTFYLITIWEIPYTQRLQLALQCLIVGLLLLLECHSEVHG